MTRRRHQHEEHLNHEAWAIPYGDLVTLLLAFFVVMYAVSSVNEGKYRVMADAMSAAFGGQAQTLAPVQLVEVEASGAPDDYAPIVSGGAPAVSTASPRQMFEVAAVAPAARTRAHMSLPAQDRSAAQLGALGTRVEHALSELVDQGLVTVRRTRTYLEIEIQSDLLFASGAAEPSIMARTTLSRIGRLLQGEPNNVRVEGYTDNVPIHTAQFRSNWELSSARAASVVHLLSAAGIAQPRLAVVGYGEHQPVADNATAAGRNSNRRVQLVILGATQPVDTVARATSAAPASTLAAAAGSDTGAPATTFTSTDSLAFGPANTPTIAGGH